MAKYYTLVPLPQGPFERLDPLARMAFGFIWERYKVSSYNVTGGGDNSPWYDPTVDEIFCVYDRAELAAVIGCSERTVRRCLDDLKAAGLIWWRKLYGGACRYYVDKPIREYLRAQ